MNAQFNNITQAISLRVDTTDLSARDVFALLSHLMKVTGYGNELYATRDPKELRRLDAAWDKAEAAYLKARGDA